MDETKFGDASGDYGCVDVFVTWRYIELVKIKDHM